MAPPKYPMISKISELHAPYLSWSKAGYTSHADSYFGFCAVGIDRPDAKSVVAWRQIGIERFTPWPGIDPFFVEAFELITKGNAAGRGQAKRAILKVDVRATRRHVRELGKCHRLAVDAHFFDNHRWGRQLAIRSSFILVLPWGSGFPTVRRNGR